MEDKIYHFRGKVIKSIYKSEDFSVYAVSVDATDYPDIKQNKYQNTSISGNLPELTEGVEYEIKAIEKESKYGVGYHVLNLRRDVPTTPEETYAFLSEVLTCGQARTIVDAYPDIISMVKENRINEIDISKLKGIGEKSIEKIKEKIIMNFHLIDLVTEFGGVLSLSMLKKIYSRYSSIEMLKKKLKEAPYTTLTRVSGIGFVKADAIVLQLQKENVFDFGYNVKTSPDRCLACVLYLLDKNEENGNTKMNLVELRSECIELVSECIDHFVDVIKDERIYYNKDTMDIALRDTYDTEKFICENIKQRLKTDINIWNYNTYMYRNINGIDLSDEQIELLNSVCKNNFIVLTAPAGAGKSFSTKALINMLKDNNKQFILCSPTGKAAKRLSQYTGEIANTIHRTLIYQEFGFYYNKNNKLPTDIVIVDEIGMTDIYLFKALLEAIDIDTKLVVIGDNFQLNSIGAGSLLRDLCSNNIIPHVTFNTIYRMGQGGVLTACTYVRNKTKFLSKNVFTQIGEDKSYSFIPANKDKMNDIVSTLYKKLLESYNVEDITVISSYNIGENGCNNLNQILQPIANPSSLKSDKFIKVIRDKTEVKYYIGDMIIQCQNNYHANSFLNECKTTDQVFVANGSIGKIVDIIDNDIIIKFDNFIVYYSREEINQVRHAFAISTHRMQGSQNKVIIFCCPSSHTFFLSNNIMYTAISRAEEKVFHLSDVKTITIAMNKSDSDKRKTFLGDMLKEVV